MLSKILKILAGSSTKSPASEYTHADTFSSPELLYRYINTNLLNESFVAENVLHIEKLRTKFVIPSHCAEQYIKEREVIQTAGILLYIKRTFPNNFYLTLREYFVDSMFNKRSLNTQMLEREEIEQVLNYYENEDDPYNCTEFFLSRVFSGTSVSDELRGSELLLNITFNFILSTSEMIHEDHMRAIGSNVQHSKNDLSL